MKPALFLHTQKTAGTSIQQMARSAYGNDKVLSHGDFMERGQEGCAPFAFVSGHFGFEFARPLMLDRYCFTFLRDPVERLISLYTFSRAQSEDRPLYRAARESSFDDFLKLGRPNAENQLLRGMIWNCQTWQLAYGRGCDHRVGDFAPGHLLVRAIENIAVFDYVGFTETSDADIPAIFRALGDPGVQPVRVNVTPERISAGDLPASTMELLSEMNELDTALYAHAKGAFSSSAPRASASA